MSEQDTLAEQVAFLAKVVLSLASSAEYQDWWSGPTTIFDEKTAFDGVNVFERLEQIAEQMGKDDHETAP